MKTETLRQALDRIMTIPYPATYRAALEQLRREYRHTIEMLPGEQQWLNTFNCYAYALGLVEIPRYRACVEQHDESTLADTPFVTSLLENGELHEISEAEIQVGTLVLYFNGTTLTHAGVVVSETARVRSKWGPSEFYEHGLWEVGASYGERVRYFAPPDPNRILDLLEAYAG